MNFVIYDTNTGEILRTGTCPDKVVKIMRDENDEQHEVVIQESMLPIQAHEGETAIEGVANDHTQYVLDGKITDYTPEQLLAKRAVPYGYTWDIATMSAVKVAEDSEITAYLATQARTKRDRLLTASDWAQASDQSPAIKTLWQPYRQALRDIPQQAGFPVTIDWPTAPT